MDGLPERRVKAAKNGLKKPGADFLCVDTPPA